jgi:Zn-dependent protease
MEGEPPRPEAEFLMAAAGPIVSFLLAFVFYVLALAAIGGGVALLPGIALYLAYVNFAIAAFNLAPAFPLDGGRVLRAALWGMLGDFARATRLAVLGGYIFSAILIAMGVVWILSGNPVRGAWWLMLGIFLATAARSTEYHERHRLNSR